MNIQLIINNKLWSSISKAYNAENYSHAILDAVQLLTDTIREKTGFDGDGIPLINYAFSGKNPLLKINKLQTQSEKDAQKGIEFMLRGLYIGIRNPRSHEYVKDDIQTANKIILFIDYLLEQIEQSDPPFTISRFINRVLDKHFVRDDEYIKLLVMEIPINKLYDSLIELYRFRDDKRTRNVPLVMKKIFNKLGDEASKDFIKFLSDELKIANDFSTQILPFQVLEPEEWKNIDDVAKIRIENIVAESIEEGRSLIKGKTIEGAGALATWSYDFLPHFRNINKISNLLTNKLNGQYEEQMYVFSFYLYLLPEIFNLDLLASNCIENLCNAVKHEQDFVDGGLRTILEEGFLMFPDDWQREIIEHLPEFEKFYNDNDIPF